MIQQAIQYPALIKYLKGFSNYSWLHYCDGRKLLLAKSLSYFEKQLPGFFRVHKTALVNPHYITDLKAPPGHKMAGSIRLKDGVILPVSRRRWSQIIDPLTVVLMQNSSLFQADKKPELIDSFPVGEPVEKRSEQQGARQIWVVMADEIKGGLVRQLINDEWPNWRPTVFETGSGLQKALSALADAEMPSMIMLDGSVVKSLPTLQAVKSNSHFRFIPTLVLLSAESLDVAGQSYASGANSVIVHPNDLTRFIQVLEKTFRYWLTMAAAPYGAIRLPLSVA